MSSAGYANRLSSYPHKGKCGLPETVDSKRTLYLKIQKLTKMIEEAKYITVLTGAGISTSAGIPDFRGPKGIWTLEEKREKEGRLKTKQQSSKQKISSSSKQAANQQNTEALESRSTKQTKKRRRINDTDSTTAAISTNQTLKKHDDISFETAKPTLTHHIITKLTKLNIIKYTITQNVDGLHRRSNLPRSKHAVLHGCIFTEKCELCHTEYFRTFDVGGLSFKKTGRTCTNKECPDGALCDTLLDWEDALPEEDYKRAQEECEHSDLCICLGTSLRIEPAASLSTKADKFVIINKQVTPYDERAALLIRAPVDDVLKKVMAGLEIELPESIE